MSISFWTRQTAGARLRCLAASLVLPVSIAASAGALVFLPTTSIAAGTNESDQDGMIEEVVVTAQKRTERRQDVAISAIVISQETQIEQNINTLDSLTETTPGIFVTPAGRSDQLDIRGIGSGVSQVFDQSVGTYIDDVYHGRSRSTAGTFLDLESIEVLKGPQSTFFGNNSVAGAFNLQTQKPTNDFQAQGRIGYSPDGNQYVVEAAAGGPLTQTLSARVAAIGNGQSGYVLNTYTGNLQPQEDNQAVRLSLLWRPTEDFDATAKVERSKNNNHSGLYLNIADCPPAAPFVAAGYCASALASGTFSPNTTMDIPGQLEDTSTSDAALTANFRQWNHTFTSVTGFYGYDFQLRAAFDAIPVPLVTANLPENYTQFSQEFRVASPTGQPVEYLAGVYFQTDHLHYVSDVNYYILSPVFESIPAFDPLDPYLPLDAEINYSQHEADYSAFGSATWNATDRLKLSAGLRGSLVHKSYDWNQTLAHPTSVYANEVPLPANLQDLAGLAGLGGPGTLSGSRSDHAWMPSGKIQYKILPDVMAYFSYSRGFKAGGFNGNDSSGIAGNLPFKPEYVNAFELGLKSEWFGNRVLVNAAIFRSNYSDLQLVSDLVTGGGSTFTSFVKNAGSARSQGVELEGQWAVTHDFRLGANFTYLNSRYVSYSNVPATQLQAFEGLTIQDLSGRPTQFAPTWSGDITASYGFTLPGDYRLTTELSEYLTTSYYNSETATDDALALQNGYGRLDGRLTLQMPGKHWAFDVIAKNLTDDQRIVIWSSNLPFSPGSVYKQFQQGRNVTFQARFQW